MAQLKLHTMDGSLAILHHGEMTCRKCNVAVWMNNFIASLVTIGLVQSVVLLYYSLFSLASIQKISEISIRIIYHYCSENRKEKIENHKFLSARAQDSRGVSAKMAAFKPMPKPTKDVLWIKVAEILRTRSSSQKCRATLTTFSANATLC